MNRRVALRVGSLALAGPVAALCLGVACWPVPEGEELARERTAIYAAVLQHLGRSSRFLGPRLKGLCVAVPEGDPGSELLESLQSLPAAGALSPCVASSADGDRPRPPEGHLLLRVTSPPHWVSGALVTVQGGDYLGDLAATGYTFRLLHLRGRWTVVSQRPLWIS